MEKKIGEFDKQQAMRLAESDIGKQLIAMLQNDHADQMEAVRDSIRSGDIRQAKKALEAFMSDEKTKALLRQLQEEQHG